jgi:HAD superfamily phosphatase (TIGR01681 family)
MVDVVHAFRLARLDAAAPESEKAAVHNIFPDIAPLAAMLDGNPYGRETVVAAAHIDALTTILAIDRKKCVIVDLDNTLWPGVLAETGAPFAWHPEISGAHSYIGLFFGIHEALKTLKKRGIVLAAVSKNDEQTVRELWKYPEHYPRDRLLTPDDFVTWRVNWTDKAAKHPLDRAGIGICAVVLYLCRRQSGGTRARPPGICRKSRAGARIFSRYAGDCSPIRVLQLPAIDRRSQSPHRTRPRADSIAANCKAASQNDQTFVESLAIQCDVRRLRDQSQIERVQELFARTTQFNATGRKFSAGELSSFLAGDSAAVYAMNVRDRFGDQGLVGAAVVLDSEIVGFALSCRVIGLGVERTFLDGILADLSVSHTQITGRIVETSRNTRRAQSLSRLRFCRSQGAGLWQLAAAASDQCLLDRAEARAARYFRSTLSPVHAQPRGLCRAHSHARCRRNMQRNFRAG